MKLLIFLFFIFFVNPVDSQEQVLDLGELEITGEVRRPNVGWIRSNKRFNDSLNSITLDEMRKFEKELLKPETGIREVFRK